MNQQLRMLQTSVKFILENAGKFKWSIQGMGMLRLYMGNTRLHIWDQSYANPGVSMIHDHAQWALRSTIIAGELINQRYAGYDSPLQKGRYLRAYNYATLKAGYGCKFMESPKRIWLRELEPEYYMAGDTYSQQPNEIHETKPCGIVITMMEKTPTDTDTARVFWPVWEQWGTAEPREATPSEINDITAKALIVLNNFIDKQ